VRSGRLLLLAALAAIGVLTGSARAAFVFEFALPGGVTVNPTVPVPILQGNTQALEVYLREDAGGTILATERLFSAGFRVTYDTPAGSGTPSNIARVTAATKGPGFDFALFPAPEIGTSNTRIVEGTAPAAFVAPTNNRILIGTVTFTAQNPGLLMITVRDDDPPPSDNTVTGMSRKLDADISMGSAQLLVTAIPEPTSLFLTGFAALGIARAAWCRRRGARANGPADSAPPETN
jgi:hypothetical protein